MFKCVMCRKYFRSRYYLNKHRKTRHTVVDEVLGVKHASHGLTLYIENNNILLKTPTADVLISPINNICL